MNTLSVIKIPVMILAFRDAEAGKLDLTARYTIRPEDLRRGSGLLQTFDIGLNPTHRDLIEQMIITSDNTATDIMIGVVGRDRVNAMLAELARDIGIERLGGGRRCAGDDEDGGEQDGLQLAEGTHGRSVEGAVKSERGTVVAYRDARREGRHLRAGRARRTPARHVDERRHGCRSTSRPDPALPLTAPASTNTSPRRMTVTGHPVTCHPS